MDRKWADASVAMIINDAFPGWLALLACWLAGWLGWLDTPDSPWDPHAGAVERKKAGMRWLRLPSDTTRQKFEYHRGLPVCIFVACSLAVSRSAHSSAGVSFNASALLRDAVRLGGYFASATRPIEWRCSVTTAAQPLAFLQSHQTLCFHRRFLLQAPKHQLRTETSPGGCCLPWCCRNSADRPGRAAGSSCLLDLCTYGCMHREHANGKARPCRRRRYQRCYMSTNYPKLPRLRRPDRAHPSAGRREMSALYAPDSTESGMDAIWLYVQWYRQAPQPFCL
jgi:hypothetical protein